VEQKAASGVVIAGGVDPNPIRIEDGRGIIVQFGDEASRSMRDERGEVHLQLCLRCAGDRRQEQPRPGVRYDNVHSRSELLGSNRFPIRSRWHTFTEPSEVGRHRVVADRAKRGDEVSPSVGRLGRAVDE